MDIPIKSIGISDAEIENFFCENKNRYLEVQRDNHRSTNNIHISFSVCLDVYQDTSLESANFPSAYNSLTTNCWRIHGRQNSDVCRQIRIR